MLYHLIGMKENGAMVLYDSTRNPYPEEDLLTIAKAMHYSQLLVVADDTGAYARYEYDPNPTLKRVALSGD